MRLLYILSIINKEYVFLLLFNSIVAFFWLVKIRSDLSLILVINH